MTKSPYESYLTSTDHVKSGIWVEELSQGLRVRVRFAGEENRKYWAEFMKNMAPFQPTLKKLDKTPEVAAIFDKKTITPALAKLFVEHIIIDWQIADGFDEDTGDFIWKDGMKDMQGEVVPFSPELVLQIILAVPRLFARIREVAGDYSNFSRDAVMADEETVKKLCEALTHGLEQGAVADFVMIAAIKRGDPIPEKLANAPQPNEVEDTIYRIFLRLSSCRLYTSSGVGPVPYDKAYNLLEQRGLLELEHFIMSCIDELDSVFMKHVSGKLKKASGG